MEITTIAVTLAIFCGALVQRVSGLGFGLVVAPFLVLLMGPHQGVLLANLLAIFVNITVLSRSTGHIEWKRAALLVPAGVLGSLPGVLAARSLPIRPLQILEGMLILAGLTLIVIKFRFRIEDNAFNTVIAGSVSGFMTATAGAGGPALTFYALAANWSQSFFITTAQLGFAAQSATAVAFKGLPDVSFSVLLPVLVALALGLSIGRRIEGSIAAPRARLLVIAIAMAGSAATIVKAVLS